MDRILYVLEDCYVSVKDGQFCGRIGFMKG